MRVERVHEPDPEHRAVYDERFSVYLDLVDAMKPHWPRLATSGT